MKIIKLAVMFVILLVGITQSASFVYAQQSQTEISQSKRQLIMGLLDQVNQTTSPEQMLDSIMKAMNNTFANTYEKEIKASTQYSEEEKEKLIKDRKVMSEKMLSRIQERFKKEIDFGKIQQDLMIELYDKYFSEQELNDLVTFYHSPTGQKTIIIMPELFGEAIKRSGELIGSKVDKISHEVVEEIMSEIKNKEKQKSE